MSRTPSTSIGTRSSTRSARAAVSTSSRNGLPGGRQDQRLASRASANAIGSRASGRSARRDERDERLVAQVLDVQPRVAHRFGDDRARELALGDLAREPLRRAFGQPQRQAGRVPAHLGNDHRHEEAAHGADDAEGRVPGLEALQHREVLVQRLDLAADRAGPFDHPHAELGRDGAPPAPDQQLHAELGLELAHVLGDVRLHRVQPVGGGGEAARLGHGQQGLELAHVHGVLLIRSGPVSGGPGTGPVAGLTIAFTDRYYRFHAFDRWSCDRLH